MPHPVEKALWRVPGQAEPMPALPPPVLAVFLFVGGPLDGQRRQLELIDGRHPCDVVPVDLRPPTPDDPVLPYRYELKSLPRFGGHQRLWFYAGEDVTDPSARLIAGYKPGAADEK